MPDHTTKIGDVCITAVKSDLGAWTIRSERARTGESLNQQHGTYSDFEAGQRYGEQCAMWRYAREPVDADLREMTEEPVMQ